MTWLVLVLVFGFLFLLYLSNSRKDPASQPNRNEQEFRPLVPGGHLRASHVAQSEIVLEPIFNGSMLHNFAKSLPQMDGKQPYCQVDCDQWDYRSATSADITRFLKVLKEASKPILKQQAKISNIQDAQLDDGKTPSPEEQKLCNLVMAKATVAKDEVELVVDAFYCTRDKAQDRIENTLSDLEDKFSELIWCCEYVFEEIENRRLFEEILSLLDGNTSVTLDYIDSKGNSTQRAIEINLMDYPCIEAFCHYRNAMRTFRIDRIAAIYNGDGIQIYTK